MNPSVQAVADAGSSTLEARLNGRGKSVPVQGARADWARLPGHTVEVWLLGEHVATGVVDQAADDDSVLWLAGAGADTRRLFDKGTGYQMWV
ncbi:hypothetical protein Achl_3460 [Pseudarthrobacter chlorophenolicus A6]|uniref:Uncharacterized protein n=1 Tax=Pseudarthrobacter chlorophenolicus (strain ATCC 700700 / DSM 12829 / CIP 107037 / JCM 12360 / KCTC 9906 / NCIMB 13794 / A6) TaxID=452863 RepID=B8HHC5_PSECP|nr:hypothetical protein [Pseudarthrobacter chlorophenolicus]ACL41416.1 hypothetical protein Achl_3460 [Pseudarthrobacter chlorophenolicus A6]SDQ64523.1 hypothetical protein SAMN04489738_2019 [Pseudarthrobacter chlorophenolicus]